MNTLWTNDGILTNVCILNVLDIEGILPKGPYLPCVSMAGRALLAGYPRYVLALWTNPLNSSRLGDVYGSVNYAIIGSTNGVSPCPTYHKLNHREHNSTKFRLEFKSFIQKLQFENVVCKIAAILFRLRCIKWYPAEVISRSIDGHFFEIEKCSPPFFWLWMYIFDVVL